MSELIADIRNYLISHSVDASGNIFLSSLPTSPDNIILISKYGGVDNFSGQEARIQIIARNTNYAIGESKIKTIRTLFDNGNPEQIINLTITRKAVFSVIQSPRFLKEDEKRRKFFVCNFRVVTDRD